MIPYPSVRELLDRHGLRAKKSWGQNFLVEERTYQAIVRAADLGPEQVTVEIGAGLGTLTARLLGTGARVVAVERDRDMCAVLRAELADQPGFILREENALTLDVPALAEEVGEGRPLTVVGNLPYQISSPLLFHFLEARGHIRRMVFMLQREVADRLLAAPDTEAYGALSAQVQILCRVGRVCQVGRGAFVPPPQVDSTVVLLEPLPLNQPLHPVRDLARYSQTVRAAFGQRRKTLRNALGAVFGPAATQALEAAGLDPGRRGETLDLQEFARLANALTEVLEGMPKEEKPDA
jgi:16S rRNA (adenine1518-N6/adenine1519-N6)-dimethyltransferase